MGNFKLRFSAMFPNSWLFKLKNIAKNKAAHHHHHHHPSESQQFPAPVKSSGDEVTEQPRRRNKRLQRRQHHQAGITPTLSCDPFCNYSDSSSGVSSSPRDVRFIHSTLPLDNFIPTDFSGSSSPTSPAHIDSGVILRSIVGRNARRTSSAYYSPGVRIRVQSPQIRGGKSGRSRGGGAVGSRRRRRGRRMGKVFDSFAVVKSSVNPEKDFRKSMVEMIMKKKIRVSKDMEDLLACYLSLNCDEYHELIIAVFRQIWVDFSQSRIN